MEARHVLTAVVSAGILLACPQFLFAQEESIDLSRLQKTLEERLPDSKIIDVRPGLVPGMYEVFTGTGLLYSDSSGDHVFSGSLIDTRTQKNLTNERINERNAIQFSSLPLDKAIKVVRGDGSRKLAVFTDPDCPYCKRLEEELQSVTNFTMYLFMFPLKQIHPNAERHAKAIWCSTDSAKAWTSWVLREREPKGNACGDDPIEANLQLGEKLHVSGTPTIYFENGVRRTGAMRAADLDAKMNEAKGG